MKEILAQGITIYPSGSGEYGWRYPIKDSPRTLETYLEAEAAYGRWYNENPGFKPYQLSISDAINLGLKSRIIWITS